MTTRSNEPRSNEPRSNEPRSNEPHGTVGIGGCGQEPVEPSAPGEHQTTAHEPAGHSHVTSGMACVVASGLMRNITSGITRTVLVLGVVSLFTDVASEMILPLRLLFFVQVLGTPLAVAALIEGVAEGGTSLLKIVSGRLADRVASRRGLVVAGYSLSNLARPLLAVVSNWPLALGLVLLDRTGKATRASPRDAMLADAVAPAQRGKAFGFHRSADTLGAAVGPLLALLILSVSGGNLRAVFGWTLLPGAFAVAVALLFMQSRRAAPTPEQMDIHADPESQRSGYEGGAEIAERQRIEAGSQDTLTAPDGPGLQAASPVPRPFMAESVTNADRGERQSDEADAPRVSSALRPLRLPLRPLRFNLSLSRFPRAAGRATRPWDSLRAGLGPRFCLFTVVAVCFALGNSSDAFLFLRTEGLEASLVAVPLIYFVFNLVYALLATPLGALSDRWGRLPVLAGGFAAFTLVYLGWARATVGWQAWVLFVVYGGYYAATEGVARAFVSDLVPTARRGTALGWFNGLTGVAAVPANLLGAWLWSAWGPQATFGLGAWLGAVALGLLVAWWPWLRRRPLAWPADSTSPRPPEIIAAAEG
jgi:MFS family permease